MKLAPAELSYLCTRYQRRNSRSHKIGFTVIAQTEIMDLEGEIIYVLNQFQDSRHNAPALEWVHNSINFRTLGTFATALYRGI